MRKAGLRLDLEESAFKKRPGHPDAIVPGHPEQSELIKRIESKDPHYLMPQSPQGEAKPMKPADIAILKEWMKEGAVYRPHWAFEKPVRAPLPVSARNDGWAKTPIDVFILARMKKEGSASLARGGQGDVDPARDAGSDRFAAYAGGGERVCEGYVAAGL